MPRKLGIYDRGMAVLLGAARGILPIPTTYAATRGFVRSTGAVPAAQGKVVKAAAITTVAQAIEYAKAGWHGAVRLAVAALPPPGSTPQPGFLEKHNGFVAASEAYRWVYDLGTWATKHGIAAPEYAPLLANLKGAVRIANEKVDAVRSGSVTPNPDRRDPVPAEPPPVISPALPSAPTDVIVPPPIVTPPAPVQPPLIQEADVTGLGTGAKLAIGAAVAGGLAYAVTQGGKKKRQR